MTYDPAVIHDAIIIGGGPAGLISAHALSKAGSSVLVLEADPRYLGGISRTEEHEGFLFDIGGHRFFSKSKEVNELWQEILPHDFIERPRKSRILYDGKLYPYPLKVSATLSNLGWIEAGKCFASYLKSAATPVRHPRSFAEWTTNQFGKRLYEMFFKTYTEKVWGIPCAEISADWAAQRIQGLSMLKLIRETIAPKGAEIGAKTLIQSFRYPRKGPGMFWNACADLVRGRGGRIELGQRVSSCRFDAKEGLWEVQTLDALKTPQTYRARNIVSSAPLRELVQMLSPAVSAETLQAAKALKYRDFLTVVLMVEGEPEFDDQWVYIHDPGVRVGRIQNFKSWSPEMVPRAGVACYGLEYFCFEGDALWTSSNADLIETAKKEFRSLGLVHGPSFVGAHVVRQPKAYPVYDDDYRKNVSKIRHELENDFPTLHLAGRNGMHKYNNQDHSMMTALICARNILAGKRALDPWKVNSDAIYHEEETSEDRESPGSGLRSVPERL